MWSGDDDMIWCEVEIMMWSRDDVMWSRDDVKWSRDDDVTRCETIMMMW